jgi:ABC-type transporter Mla maintaining outer membrane lipid asymmetry ATPase subunit MlaF
VPVVELHNVAFGYGDELVLKEVSLAPRPGETLALVGSSGGGNVDALKLILGAYPVSAGASISWATICPTGHYRPPAGRWPSWPRIPFSFL